MLSLDTNTEMINLYLKNHMKKTWIYKPKHFKI